jgi:hypothetical protein
MPIVMLIIPAGKSPELLFLGMLHARNWRGASRGIRRRTPAQRIAMAREIKLGLSLRGMARASAMSYWGQKPE